MIEEISSAPATVEEPEHALSVEEADEAGGSTSVLRLVVSLPRVAAVSEIDLEMGAWAVSLTAADGSYALKVSLPRAVDQDVAKCKFDKKRRVLTLTMPARAVAVA